MIHLCVCSERTKGFTCSGRYASVHYFLDKIGMYAIWDVIPFVLWKWSDIVSLALYSYSGTEDGKIDTDSGMIKSEGESRR